MATCSSLESTPMSEEESLSFESNYSTPSTEPFILFDDPIQPPSEATQVDGLVLVVGGLGFIGSHTVWELLQDGQNVIIVDNLSNSYLNVLDRLRQLVKSHWHSSRAVPSLFFHEADYRDSTTMSHILSQYQLHGSCSKTTRIRGVIHFAAHKSVAESIDYPLKYYANNVAGLIDFCTLLDSFDIRTLIFSSSATVYGELANQGGQLREELCTHATTRWRDTHGQERITFSGSTGLTNPYGRSKWMCEAILSDLAKSDARWKILALRYFNPTGCDSSGLLGEDPRGTPNNLMPVLVQAVTGQRSQLDIFGSDWETKDGTAVRDFIHVSCLAQGHLAALQKATLDPDLSGFSAINLGTGSGNTVCEVISAMEEVLGRSIPTQMVARRDGDVGVCIASTSKASEMLGWQAKRTIHDSCRDIAKYLRLIPC